MYVQLEINGAPYTGRAYQTQEGTMIYLPRLHTPLAAPIHDLLQVVPELNVFAYEVALRILEDAEEALGAKSMAQMRAANGSWRQPANVADFLFWIEDEAIVQEDQQRTGSRESRSRRHYTRALRGVANELRELGFVPSPPPWDGPEIPVPFQPLAPVIGS
jgi:hypothetical protein